MSSHVDGDEQWVRELREAFEDARNVPRAVREAGYAAYTWRSIDAELAALTYDSTVEDPALVGARSQQASLRSMSFASRSVTIELEVAPPQLLGQIVPAGGAELTVSLRDGGSATVPVDDLGCFTVSPVPTGPFRLELTAPAHVVTDWITL
jgi:hypothetical protein